MPFKEGDFVLINYTTKVVEDGEERVIDTTVEEVARKAGIYDPRRRYEPYPVIVGKSKLIDAVDEALRSMEVGEKKTIEAPPEKAYGPRDQRLVRRVPIKYFMRYGRAPRVGEEVEMEVEGRVLRGKVVNVTQRFVHIDFNHPLAGKTLKIDLEVVEKVDDDREKTRILVARVAGIPRDSIKVDKDDGHLVIKLPPMILALNDLEAILQSILNDIQEYLSPEKVTFTIEIDLKPREAPKETPESSGESRQTEEESKG
ncbi:MAG: peptidylprolyl isomerase [Desulfurococcales archaeon]|nr:peptidylprolyl isomerase [Desulfurococcales archaeon]